MAGILSDPSNNTSPLLFSPRYLPGEGEGFLCGRAGYVRSLLWMLDCARFGKTKTRIIGLIKEASESMVRSLQQHARENPLESLLLPDSHPYVVLPLRCQQLQDIKNTLLIKKGDVGGSMGLMGTESDSMAKSCASASIL